MINNLSQYEAFLLWSNDDRASLRYKLASSTDDNQMPIHCKMNADWIIMFCPIGREFKDCHLNPNINLSIWWPHWLKIKGQIFPLVWIWWQNIVLKYLSIEELDYLHKCGSMILRNAWSLPWIPFVEMVISTIVDIMMMKLRTDERPVLKYWSPKRVTSFMNTNWQLNR